MSTPIIGVTPIIMPVGYPYAKYLPSAYDDSLSIYGELTQIRAFLMDVVNHQNEVIEKFNELIAWFYGKGLEETVIKVLNQWIKEGKFDEIIAQVVEELKMIRELVEPIHYGKDFVTVTKHREYETNYYLTHIKMEEQFCNCEDEMADPNKIIIKHGYAMDSFNTVQGETCREFHTRHENTVTMNASVWDNDHKMIGISIQDGKLISDRMHDALWTLTVDSKGKFYSYSPATRGQDLIDNHDVQQAWTGFYPLIMDGKQVDPSIWEHNAADTIALGNRNAIGQYANGNIVILTSEGRTALNKGLTYAMMIEIFNKLGVNFAYNLDGGGSTSTSVRNYQLNRPYDGRGKIDRKQGDFLYIRKPHENKNLGLIPEDINELKKLIDDNYANLYNLSEVRTSIFKQIMPKDVTFGGIEFWEEDIRHSKMLVNKDYFSMVKYDAQGENGLNYFKVNRETGVVETVKGRFGEFMGGTLVVEDANSVMVNGEYRATGSTINTPKPATWILKVYRASDNDMIQIAIPFTRTEATYIRTKGSGTWGEWQKYIEPSQS
ncbi:hypothetical protein VMY22_17 [Bacillus phage VMY22]|uniref:Phosphodiester glycosidase domain-containing protein n=1 Tax=Bacillus phage VMY22 TaxID=1734382 RepID=A0A0N9RRG0_9CAUD|nr:hypothetical protein VMY22_17 [Bacillus phage VMY22]ALH46482.1 hypothetical protein VMY22_17 [Bacillus phage VMY22]